MQQDVKVLEIADALERGWVHKVAHVWTPSKSCLYKFFYGNSSVRRQLSVHIRRQTKLQPDDDMLDARRKGIGKVIVENGIVALAKESLVLRVDGQRPVEAGREDELLNRGIDLQRLNLPCSVFRQLSGTSRQEVQLVAGNHLAHF